MLDLVTYWKGVEGGGSAVPERTLKSDVLCEWEAISRSAKIRWAEEQGHDWLSLQHDGVVIAFRPGIVPESARHALEEVCRRALGYAQPVEFKQMEVDDDPSPPPPVEPARGRRPATVRGRGVGVRGSNHHSNLAFGILPVVVDVTLSDPISDVDYLYEPSGRVCGLWGVACHAPGRPARSAIPRVRWHQQQQWLCPTRPPSTLALRASPIEAREG